VDRSRVQSKLLKSIGYDAQSQVLEIEFHPRNASDTGTVYRYFKVPIDVANRLMSDRSQGSFFLNKIKGEYEYRKVEADETPEIAADGDTARTS
jgi:hypothetical protein